MNRSEKQQVVSEFSKKLEGIQAIVLTNFRGLNVEQLNNLRRRLREEKVSYHVVKNTLMKLAAKGTPLERLTDYFEGPTAVALSYGDPVLLAKVLSEFIKTQPNLEIKAGLIQGRFAGPDEIKTLATLPSREVLLAQLMAGIQASGQYIAGALLGLLQQVVGIIQARADQISQQQGTES
ncbi:MAG: 50S ribosomal protein L10 [Thermodesulfobacteriota bacterium]